jgi:hypothetical protein
LIDAREPKKLAVLSEIVIRIGVAWKLVVRHKKGDAVGLHIGRKTTAVMDKKFGIDGFVTHAFELSPPN